MEEDYITISTLNDFIFCPYSIYLHNVYENTDESIFHATPQTQGRIAHLFNFIECFLRMYGFDLYVGVFHRLWFKRKSLVCDVMEPFRCIIDRAVRTAYHRKQISVKDFTIEKGEYRLKRELSQYYYKVFVEALMSYKMDIFLFIQSYYRAFMRNAPTQAYPQFSLSS